MKESLLRRALRAVFGDRRSDSGFNEDEGGWNLDLMRSGMVTATLLLAIIAIVGIVYHERGRGDLHRLQNHINPGEASAPPEAPKPGGQDAVTLTRSQLMGGSTPQFLSATVLPGRGMNVLQITAYIPGKGEIPLLASPDLEGANRILSGKGDDSHGTGSLEVGGAILAPWAGRISGTNATAKDGEHMVTTSWSGHPLMLPLTPEEVVNGRDGVPVANGGLLLKRASDSVETDAMPDGGVTTATFHAGDFGGHWLSDTDIQTTVLMSGRIVEVTITAKNVGSIPEPMGLGWQPRFSVPSGERSHIRLHIPAAKRLEIADSGSRRGDSGLPTGRFLPVDGTAYDFRARDGKPLGPDDLDTTFTDLQTGFLDNGPMFEWSDPAMGLGLRITALDMKMQAVQVKCPLVGNFLSVVPQFNFDDPFGHEWLGDQSSRMQVLQPGQSIEWKVRLELFDPNLLSHSGDTEPGSHTPAAPASSSP